MLGNDLTFLAYKFPNFGGFQREIFPNFGMSEKSEKIETFMSKNFRSTILTYKIFDLDLQIIIIKFGSLYTKTKKRY